MMFKNPTWFYKIATNYGQGGTTFKRDTDNARIDETTEKIVYESFVQEYRQHYFREDTPELCRFILASTTKAITSICASLIHTHTKTRITISPDGMFKQLTDYNVLFPDEANIWLFSLAEPYSRALTPAMEMDMTQNGFKMPVHSKSDIEKNKLQHST